MTRDTVAGFVEQLSRFYALLFQASSKCARFQLEELPRRFQRASDVRRILDKQPEIAERRDRGRLTQQQADMFALGRFGAFVEQMAKRNNVANRQPIRNNC